tara:strand:+ start:122 stop:1219 length:1098 start_codon:yes stop_codon:yes gene_type:complete
MGVDLIFILNISFGLLIIFIMLFSGKTNIRVNIYLLLIITLQISHRAFVFYVKLNNLDSTFLDNYSTIYSLLIVPCIYLYACTLMTKKKEFKKDIIHFILPALFFLISTFIYETTHQQNSIFTFFWVGTYLLLIYAKIIDFNKSSLIMDKSVSRWIYFLFSAVGFNYLLGIGLGIYFGFSSREWLIDFYIVGSVVWILTFVYIFLNPIILYGRIILIKNIVVREPDISFWMFSPIKQVDQKHLYIQNALHNKISQHIYEIIKLQTNDQLIKENNFTVAFLSSQLSIPKSHLTYLLTYHSKHRGNDYINLIKILKSQRLIKAGYLENKTIESLAQECNFNSRSTFFKNFKKVTGASIRATPKYATI